ncbi:DUF1292 domain-containing protein [Paenibacillus pinistramenti]|uniref:DUF1292 domain-containing protein n=1 Tax=Paenibacillus pinistramenti TaxID=1768003 RepID=UPI00193997D0|nr:DUF1292 domain-containing protein [Paenibacillus pinistramenti]
MPGFNKEEVVWTSRIRDAFGPVVELQDENGETTYYQVEKEFDVSGGSYAVLRPDVPGRTEEEPEILKVVTGADGELSLETIDDDDEWEDISELYDELTFSE